jgi:hypothetical protein
MINGLSMSTTNAGKAINYFLGDDYYDKKENKWKEREPKPVILEGDPQAMKFICDKLKFKNQYTTGVLSFNAEETAMIAANPELKDEILQDFKDFAFAGVPDCARHFLAIEHTHTENGRLEIHYMMPRVNLESGKYWNPFPPNYSGKVGKGNNQAFIKENDAYIDHACAKFGLTNPRDPRIARDLKINSFDAESASKKDIHNIVCELVVSKHITCREDIESLFKKLGGTIVRNPDDYISVRFAGDKKSMKFKGDIYDSSEFGAKAISETAANRREGAEERSVEREYESVLQHRTAETLRRHSPKRSDDIDLGEPELAIAGQELGFESELEDLQAEFETFENSTDDLADIKSATAGFVSDHREEVTAAQGKAASIPTGVSDVASVAAMVSDDPAIRFFNNQTKQHVEKQIQRALAAAKKGGMWSEPSAADKLQMERIRVAINAMVGLLTGIDVNRPGVAFDRKALTEATATASGLAQERAQVLEAERQQVIKDAVAEKLASRIHEQQDAEERARQDRERRVPSWKRNGHDLDDQDSGYRPGGS